MTVLFICTFISIYTFSLLNFPFHNPPTVSLHIKTATVHYRESPADSLSMLDDTLRSV